MASVCYKVIQVEDAQEDRSMSAASRSVYRNDPDTVIPIHWKAVSVIHSATLAELSASGEVEFARNIDLYFWKPLIDQPLEVSVPKSPNRAVATIYRCNPMAFHPQ